MSTDSTSVSDESDYRRDWPTPPVRGAIPRVEKQQAHKEFIWAVRPPTIMISMRHVRNLLRDDETADTWFPPETAVITTTTIPDTDLADLDPREELSLIAAFEPAYHVPSDFPVYADMSTIDRLQNCFRTRLGTEIIAKKVTDAGLNTTILPLIKGTTVRELSICAGVVPEINAPLAVKYAAQYLNVGGGGGFPYLAEHVEMIDQLTMGFPLLLIGYLNPSDNGGAVPGRNHSLDALPDNVVAASGRNQWLPIMRDSPDESTMQRDYQGLARDVADALGFNELPNDVLPTPFTADGGGAYQGFQNDGSNLETVTAAGPPPLTRGYDNTKTGSRLGDHAVRSIYLGGPRLGPSLVDTTVSPSMVVNAIDDGDPDPLAIAAIPTPYLQAIQEVREMTIELVEREYGGTPDGDLPHPADRWPTIDEYRAWRDQSHPSTFEMRNTLGEDFSWESTVDALESTVNRLQAVTSRSRRQ